MRLLLEAVCVGMITLVVGLLIGKILVSFLSVKLPDACKNWNKYHIMEINLFLTGFLIHILFEILGLNKWYSVNYVKNL
jgi:hypothetical protein|tara:strand:- start:1653 stop:1889 length:237 start_codon:yes stop_codon:yes gene_type:complete